MSETDLIRILQGYGNRDDIIYAVLDAVFVFEVLTKIEQAEGGTEGLTMSEPLRV